jgi:hypothetical protein
MPKSTGYRFLKMGLSAGLAAILAVSIAHAQKAPTVPSESDLYCPGLPTTEAVPTNTYLISGENSRYKITFSQGDHVYINKGFEQGVKVGDQFEVVRAAKDALKNKWFKWQLQLSNAMGTTYMDIGRLRVVKVLGKTSIADLTLTCDLMQRGDIVLPFKARVAPAFHNTTFDPYAAPSGKPTAMLVTTKHFGQVAGSGGIVYVNLGSDQGVHVGDYYRVFRYQGTHNDTIYQIRNTAYEVYGFGSTPVKYHWDDLPRQVLGEGIVLRTGPNSSTVLLTTTREEVYAGDYVEVE